MAAQRYLQCSCRIKTFGILRIACSLQGAARYKVSWKHPSRTTNPTFHTFHGTAKPHKSGDDQEYVTNVAFEPDTISSNSNDGGLYRRLSNDRAFRLVTLHPGSYQGDIRLSVDETHLDKNVSYEALSYVCMDPYAEKSFGYSLPIFPTKGPEKLRPIILNNRNIGVTTNLYLALRRLRLETKQRVLWIDSLCIHQSDLQDKQQQLLLMKSIYPKAKKVIVWLGEQDKNTESAMNIVKRWSDIHRGTKGASPPVLLAKIKASGEFKNEQGLFESLIRRAWFTRVWTLQEICLARDADIMCGQHFISWSTFRHACATVIKAGQREFVFEENSNIRAVYDITKLSWEKAKKGDSGGDERFHLSRLLQRTRLREATSSHDRLYALLGMATLPTRNKSAYKVDYSLPIQEVYTRYTREMIIEDGDLGALSLVKKPKKDYLLKRKALRRRIRPVPNLPSWVPDLRHQDCVEYIADSSHVRTMPAGRPRTRFPQPIAQQYNDGWPRYWLNLSQSYNVKGEITFDVKDPTKLGLFGVRVDRINKVFTMEKFTSDPFIRHPAETSNNTTKKHGAGQFDWKTWFSLPEFSGNSKHRLVLEETYHKTGEAMSIAILRTCSADFLPISKRLPQIQKKIHFPRHFDWFYWSKRRENNWIKGLPFPLTVLTIMKLVGILWDRRRISDRSVTKNGWTAFDRKALRDSDQCYRMYEEFLGCSGKRERTKQAISQMPTAFKPEVWSIWAAVLFYENHLLSTISRLFELPGVVPGSAIVALLLAVSHALRQQMFLRATPVASNPTVAGRWRGIEDQVVIDENVKLAIEVQDAINRASWCRVFFTTDDGYIGIGPIGTRTGDVVYSLIGGHVPFVLQPTDQPDEFKLIGESYVHGILDGQLWTKRPGSHIRWDNLDEMKSVASRVILV